ncbi:ankyrin repeat domain-containing protein 60-like isoform X1 [Narcine bancroftii]|uniref:ankyrin repeat domain-containing protein 60-like isoform X1 n=2 Tax=Narcine bancroftii TaxID=1343680 RepID=UPI0038316E82
MPRKRTFNLRVHLEETGENFRVRGCRSDMKIGELKSKLELITAIPTTFQRLYYFDEGEMPDNVTLKFNGVISGGKIRMKTWSQDGWKNLFRAAALGNIQELLSLGATKFSDYSNPNLRGMSAEQRAAWIAERSFVALLITSHRGHINAVKFLLMNGADMNTRTADGHSALHMAVSGGRGQCINHLLQRGADIQGTDNKGQTVLDLARVTGHKENFGKILLFQWARRTANLKPPNPIQRTGLFAHQMYDSTLKTWQVGTHKKVYMATLLKTPESQHASGPTPTKPKAGSSKAQKTTQS